MKVAITIDELDMGGAQHIVYEIVKNIDYKHCSIVIVCIDGRVHSLLEKEMIRLSSEKKYDIIFLKNRPLNKLNTNIEIVNKVYNKIRRILLDIIIIIDVYNTLHKIKPDIVHAHQHGIWSFLWTTKHHVPLLTTVHTNPEAAFSRETEQFFLKKSIKLKKNVFAAISKYNFYYIKKYWDLPDECIRCINNGIKIDDFNTKKHDIFSFINVARQDENKNQIMIINAFYRLFYEDKNISMRLYLIGDGVSHNALVQSVKNCNLEEYIIFTGYINSAKEYYAVSDVYISSAHREGLSLSVLEAMASSLPIIATDAGGVRDLAQENGILIKDNDEEALYHSMKELRDNRALRIAKGKKSLEMVQEYSASVMAKEYKSLYEELTKKML